LFFIVAIFGGDFTLFYQVRKDQARQVLIKTAEKNGVAWRQYCEDFDYFDVKNVSTDKKINVTFESF
jgi:hypothetical protein